MPLNKNDYFTSGYSLTSDKYENSYYTSASFFIHDRIDNSVYKSPITSSYFGKILKAYVGNLEKERLKNNFQVLTTVVPMGAQILQ
jgi:hypothetical protein